MILSRDPAGHRYIPCFRDADVIMGAQSKKSSNDCFHWLFLESRLVPPSQIRRNAPVFWDTLKHRCLCIDFTKYRARRWFVIPATAGGYPRHSPA